MTDKEAAEQSCLAKLKEWQVSGDVEMAHHFADEALCELLKTLGYGHIVAEWEKVDKWYA